MAAKHRSNGPKAHGSPTILNGQSDAEALIVKDQTNSR